MSKTITELKKLDNWLIKSLLSGEKYDPYQMRLEYLID